MDFLFILLVYRSIQFCLFSFFSKLLLRWIFVYSTFSDIAIKICYDKYSLYNLKLSYINTFSTITPVNPHLTPRYLQYRTPNPLNCSPHAVSQTFIKHIWFTPTPHPQEWTLLHYTWATSYWVMCSPYSSEYQASTPISCVFTSTELYCGWEWRRFCIVITFTSLSRVPIHHYLGYLCILHSETIDITILFYHTSHLSLNSLHLFTKLFQI